MKPGKVGDRVVHAYESKHLWNGVRGKEVRLLAELGAAVKAKVAADVACAGAHRALERHDKRKGELVNAVYTSGGEEVRARQKATKAKEALEAHYKAQTGGDQ